MSAQIPTPSALAQRFAAALAQQQFTASDGMLVTLDALAPATLESALSILSGLTDYEAYLYLRDQLLELMVTTATENGLLPQHAEIWRTPREGATAAIGNFIVSSTGTSDVTLPIGTLITVDGSVQWSVTAATTIAAGASASVPVQATVTGTSGNLAANTSGTLVSPVAGISSVVSDQDGLAGGADIEGVESWRARIIAAIRTPPGAGTKADYLRWLTAAGAGVCNVVPAYDGPGTVGLIVLMPGYVVPTTAQIAALQASIDADRPVRGNATVYPGVLVPQSPQIKLNPDTSAARAAVQKDLTPYYLGLGLGGTIYVEAIQTVISSAAGSANTLVSPTQDQTLAANEIATLGTISWVTS